MTTAQVWRVLVYCTWCAQQGEVAVLCPPVRCTEGQNSATSVTASTCTHMLDSKQPYQAAPRCSTRARKCSLARVRLCAGFVKCGFAGDLWPRAVFPCVVGHPANPRHGEEQVRYFYLRSAFC